MTSCFHFQAKSGIIIDEDARNVEKMLLAHVTAIMKAREERKQRDNGKFDCMYVDRPN